MIRQLLVGATTCAVCIAVGSGGAQAGEVTGNGKPIEIHANSDCAFSGLEDFDGEGVDPGVVQNWGKVKDAPVVVESTGASTVVLDFGGGPFETGCNAHLHPVGGG